MFMFMKKNYILQLERYFNFLASAVNSPGFGVKQAGYGMFPPVRFGGQWG